MTREEKMVGENEVAKFYRTAWTESLEQYAATKGFEPKISCFVAERKDDSERSYILVQNNQYIFANQQYEGIAYFIDALSLTK